MELVDRRLLPFAKEQAVPLGGECGVAEAHQPLLGEAPARQHPGHGAGPAPRGRQTLSQVEEAPALRHRGQAGLHRRPHRPEHGPVGGKGFGVELRVAPGQVQPAGPFWQPLVP